MGQHILFSNTEIVTTLKNYLYSNRLSEDEISKHLKEFGNSCYIKGLDHGDIVRSNVNKRIKSAELAVRDKHFNETFEDIEDEIDQRILNSKKK